MLESKSEPESNGFLDSELESESEEKTRLRSPGFKSKGMVLALSRQKCMTFNCFHFPVLE